MSDKQHISTVICGHVDSGKSSLTGFLLTKLGIVDERKLANLKAEAEKQGKSSFFYAYVTDTSKAERERGITIQCATREFFTDRYHYTIVDAPGHRDFIRSMVSGSSTCEMGVLMVPADDGFATAVRKENRKNNEVEGQSRQHALLLNLLGIKQLVICINKMDTVDYKQERFEEVKAEMLNMLARIGWPKAFLKTNVAIIPTAGFHGDNIVDKSDKMPWWNGVDVKNMNGETVHVDTLVDAFDKYACIPPRKPDAPLRIPVGGVHSIKGVGDVITGRVEQGTVKPGQSVKFIPSDGAVPCRGKVFSVEMHHKSVPAACPGDNVGLNIKGLDKKFRPKAGDVIVLENDTSIPKINSFTAQIQVLNHPGELKVGYTPVGLVRTARSAIRMTAINWKKGKSTNGTKVESPATLVQGDMAEVVFAPGPSTPMVVEPFTSCDGLGRLAVLEGHSVVMLGRIMAVNSA